MSAASKHADLGRALLYSQSWEDIEVARRALRVRPSDSVLAIGSAGDNAIALLQDDPARVIAIDVNPAQTALLELKAGAFRTWSSPSEVSAFLGAGDGVRRDEHYEVLRPTLSAAATRYWDAHPRSISRGVLHSGRFERYLATFRRVVLPLAPGPSTVREMLLARTLAEQRRIYTSRWDSVRWRLLFRLFGSRRVLAMGGRHRAFFERSEVRDVGRHYLARVRLALTALPIWRNPYVTSMLSGRYGAGERTPDYLRPELHSMLRERIDRLHVRTAHLDEALRGLPSGSIDAFYLSDVFELASSEQYEGTLAEIARVGRPGARLCYWNNLVSRRRPDHLAGLIDSHPEEAAQLHRCDRAFLYSALVVESVRERTPAR